jgi:hypothetical protein
MYKQFSAADQDLLATKAAAAKYEKEYQDALKKNQEKYDNWQRLKVKSEILSSLMPDQRLFWAQKLDMLTKLTPEGVYITSVDVTEEVKMVETDFSKKRRAEYAAALAVARKKDQDAENAKKQKAAAASGAPEKEAKKETSSTKKPVQGEFEKALGEEPIQTMRPQITQTLTISAVTRFDEERGLHREKFLEFQRQLDSYRETTPDGQEIAFRDYFVIDRPESARTVEETPPAAKPAAKAAAKAEAKKDAQPAATGTTAKRNLTRPPRKAAAGEEPKRPQLIFRDGTLRIIPDRQSMEELDGLTVWAFALKLETIPI